MGLQSFGAEDIKSECEEQTSEYALCGFEEFFKAVSQEKEVTVSVDNEKIYMASGFKVIEISFNCKEQIKAILSLEGIKINATDSKNFFSAMESVYEPESVNFDLSLAGYLCSPSANSYDVERLANEYLKTKVTIQTENENLKNIAIAKELCTVLSDEIKKCDMDMLLREIELPLAKLLSEMEREGILLDANGIEDMGMRLSERIDLLEKEIHDLAGEEFNVKSPQQLGHILFEKLELKHGKKTKSGYSTTAEILEKLKYDHPIIPKILEYRALTKLNSTYCEGLLKAIKEDGRVHSTFNQTETRTGRISSLEPNLQNIPVRREEGRELRKFFIAKKGYLLLDSDYSQIELRVLAHMAKDKTMISAFNSGEDIHTKTAGEVFDMPPLLVTPKMRSAAKAVNFGIIYGMGAFTLGQDIGVSRAEAQRYIDGYFATYPGIKKFMENSVESAKEKGYSETMFGRRRYLPELSSSNGMLRAFGERVARNMPIQGTAADIIKLAMVRVRKGLKEKGLDARIILQVHDELIVEAEESIAPIAAEILEREMENAVKLSVPLIAECHKAKTWYEAKG
jgi:DNA polymerase-1